MVREALDTSVTCTPPLGPPVKFQIPKINIAKEYFAFLSFGFYTRNIFQNPFDLGAGEICS